MKTPMVIATLLFAGSFTSAQEHREDQRAKISLLKTQIIQGEPLVLDYQFQNIVSDHSSLVQKNDDREWMSLKITSRDGKRINPASDFRPAPGTSYVYGGHPLLLLTPAMKITGKIVLGQWAQFRRPGTYRIEVRLTPSKLIRNATTQEVFVKTFLVTVSPVSVYQLHRLADKFLQQARTASGQEQLTALQALFSLPDFAAREQWATLVSNEKNEIILQEIREQLVRIGTPLTSELLQTLEQRRQENLNEDPQYLQSKREAEADEKRGE